MKRIVIVTSQLGFGHFTRQLGLAEALISKGDITVDIIADKDKFNHFPKFDKMHLNYIESPPLPTFVSQNMSTIDIESTKYSFQMMLDFDTQVRDDRAWDQILQGADLLVNDIESFHNPIARKLGLPIVNISNFTWSDLLYDLELTELADQIAILERYSDLNLKLPFSTECRSFGTNTKDVGLLLRLLENNDKKENSPSILIKQMPFDLTFGLSEFCKRLIEINWQIYLSKEMFASIDKVLQVQSSITCVDDSQKYLNAIATANIFVGKTGYSSVAECAHYGTHMLYWTREGLLEDHVLSSSVQKLGIGEVMKPDLDEVLLQIEKYRELKFKQIPQENTEIAQLLLNMIN